MTNIIALNPKDPGSPLRACKDCAVTTLIKRNVPYVKGIGAGKKGYCQFDVAI
jgi:hypothetical protein